MMNQTVIFWYHKKEKIHALRFVKSIKPQTITSVLKKCPFSHNEPC